jgi:hypothetical protein
MSHLGRLNDAAREHFGATHVGEPEPDAVWWAERAAELARIADEAEARVDRVSAELTQLAERHR